MDVGLKRDITRTNILIAAAGGMIGCGWLFAPYMAAQMAGSNALIGWIIAACFMFLIALPLCELGAMFPISGGMINYPTFTHGSDIGFVFAWVSWLAYVVMTPIEVQAILQYLSYFFPRLVLNTQVGSAELSSLGYFVAISLMLIVVLLNSFGIKLLAECNKYASVIKFIIPGLATIALFTTAPFLQNVQLDLATSEGWKGIFTALSTAGVIFAFTGFQNGLVLAGEVQNPQTNIPIAILGAVLIGLIIYFFLQLSFIVAIPPKYLAHGWSHLTFPDASAPLVGLTLLVGLGWVAMLLMFDASFSPFGTALVYTAATSRILYGMALNQHLPQFFLKVNRYGIPTRTLLINLLVGSLAFLPFPGWQKMVAFLSSCSILSYSIGPICLLSMRKLNPNYPRPFRLWFATPLCYMAFYICNLMLHWCGFDIQWKLFLAIFIGFLIHCINKKQEHSFQPLALVWLITYLLSLLLISYFSSFGGINMIKFPFDLGYIFVISVVFLFFSQFVAIESHEHKKIISAQSNYFKS